MAATIARVVPLAPTIRYAGASHVGLYPTMDTKLLELLVCPVTKGPLTHERERHELWSRSARLAYPVRDGIPVMLEAEARTLSDDELGL